jgi:uracil permease
MPAAVIGPTVAIIGLSLATNAVGDSVKGATWDSINAIWIMNGQSTVSFVCAIVTLITIVICSVYGKKMMKMIPFIIGILAGYATAGIFTLIGKLASVPALVVLDFTPFTQMEWVPGFTFIEAFKGFSEVGGFGKYLVVLLASYIPVAFVVFAEHLADHKNISSIIGEDLTKDPGLHRTLLGDGVGSMAGAFFGGCPNTTYGESVGCVAISGNASVVTILTAAIICIIASFFGPFTAFLKTIPSCVMGGVCITLYGFIAVSGLKMIQKVDLSKNYNLFTVATILIGGVGSMSLKFGIIPLKAIAVSLILGIIVNAIGKKAAKKDEESEAKAE